MYKLRQYQEEAVEKALEFLQSNSKAKGFVVSPTASGKSLLIAEVAKRLGGKTLVFQPSKELLEQNYAKYISYGNTAGIYSASAKSRTVEDVTFATIGSVKSLAGYFKEKGFKNILVDENHFACKPGSLLDKFIQQSKITNVLGFTATPVILKNTLAGTMWKMLNRTKDSIFSTPVHVVQIKQMMEEKWWTPIVYEVAEVDLKPLELNTIGTDYTMESMKRFYKANALERNIAMNLDRLREQEGIDSSIIFFPSVDEASSFAKMYPGSEMICSDTKKKERSRIIEDFRSGKIKYLCNVNILVLGFDHPPLKSIVMARPTNSFTIYYQQIGRGVRLFDGKKYVKVLDLSGNTERFGKVEDVEFVDDIIEGWGMYSNGVKMTDVPLLTLPESLQEAREHRILTQELGEKVHTTKDLIFSFGKYEGKSIKVVPNSYLEWMLREYNFGTQIGFRKKIREELTHRIKNNIIIKDTWQIY